MIHHGTFKGCSAPTQREKNTTVTSSSPQHLCRAGLALDADATSFGFGGGAPRGTGDAIDSSCRRCDLITSHGKITGLTDVQSSNSSKTSGKRCWNFGLLDLAHGLGCIELISFLSNLTCDSLVTSKGQILLGGRSFLCLQKVSRSGRHNCKDRKIHKAKQKYHWMYDAFVVETSAFRLFATNSQIHRCLAHRRFCRAPNRWFGGCLTPIGTRCPSCSSLHWCLSNHIGHKVNNRASHGLAKGNLNYWSFKTMVQVQCRFTACTCN